jgi:hypothetical protein
MTGSAGRFVAMAALLGAIAAIAQPPVSGDRDVYQKIGRQLVVLDCHDVHCYRILPAPILEHLPGPSLLKWKTYAVLTSAAAALALGRLCLVLGLSSRAAMFATWIAAFGFGPLQAVFDPYTSDPVMYLLAPLMMADLLAERIGRPAIVGCLGVLSKEFAAAPLWIFATLASLRRQWETASKAALAALTATLVWFALQTLLMTLYNYSYGNNPSVIRLLEGGYFRVWTNALGWPRALAALFMTFGPLFVLLPAGFTRADRTLRLLALASVPAMAAFVYVQQPDRALWNFHFVVIPIAVLALEALPDSLCWPFVAAFAVANLRLGEGQPAAVTWLRGTMLVASLAIAAIAASSTRRRGPLQALGAEASRP